MTKIAILSVSAGAGHLRAAEALKTAVEARLPGATATHLDVMELVPKLFRKIYADSYLKVVDRHPALWGYLYHTADRAKPDGTLTRLRQAVERLNTRAFASRLAELAPDYVICTHFLPAQLLSRMIGKGTFTKPVWVVVTDFDIHALWVHPHLTGYCAAAEEISWRMRDRGLRDSRIAVTGIPIMPAFSTSPDRATCAAELGIDPRRTTLLMMSGGFGVGAIDQLAERLLGIPGDFQIVALAGRNAELLEKLRAVGARFPGRLHAQGFTRTIERVMACADLAITKPGGLTSSECLAVGLPMVVVSPIPGQEERNSDYLLENGAALKAHDAAGLEYRVRALLADPKRLAAMRANAKRIGTPQAASSVLDAVLGA
ncbi:MAG: galactosyldiacylglycerol synthase [Planctomycetes bacterium]|nr:galactosyldiacylglycerol synthase [Planctomycetota bacterium]